MTQAVPIWRQLERQTVARALSRAWAKTGKRIAARMAMIAITTRSSIRVNPLFRLAIEALSFRDCPASLSDEDGMEACAAPGFALCRQDPSVRACEHSQAGIPRSL